MLLASIPFRKGAELNHPRRQRLLSRLLYLTQLCEASLPRCQQIQPNTFPGHISTEFH